MTVTLLPPAHHACVGQTTAAEELIRLREETKKKYEQLASLIQQLAATKKKPNSKIPRPEGQAGRSSGYILRDEMGLADDSDRYNRLFRIVKDHTHQYLAVKETISKQNKAQVDAVLAQIAKSAPYFARFEGYWPAKDMITGYLLNMQTRRRKDLQLEAQADLRDRAGKASKQSKRNTNETDIETPNTPEPRAAKKPGKRRVNLRVESDEESCEDNFESPRNKSNIPLQDEGSEDEMDVKPHKKKRTFLHFTDEDSHGSDEPPAKMKFNVRYSSPAKPKSQAEPELTWHDLPLSCMECAELLPVEPHPRILGLFVKREKLIGNTGSTAAGLPLIELQICEAITQEKDRERHADLGRRNGWLHNINFKTLPERIEGFEDEILQMIQDPDHLEQSAAWRSFLKSIDGQLFRFCRSRSKGEFIYAVYGSRCGYYGPKGAQIINSKLMDALDGDNASNVLFATLNEVILMNEDSLDAYDPTSNLLDIEDFIFFVLAPFTAALLISADKGVAFEDAVDICDNSCAFGDIFQPEEDSKSANNNESEVEEVTSGVKAKESQEVDQEPVEEAKPETSKAREVILEDLQTSTITSSLQKPKVKARAVISLDDFKEAS
ncbi:hypothetical protein B0H16DRAFT_1477460 [Mycena metata]|uniref:Restriction of telomere capping protein 4 n=1 Tax=Mycena metata TaxID=1033252 RepID=A0AAD7H9N3_9AGAR|nr:hypothetical protein B0H16DRAFT_1477460 [Mycena metata]